MQLRTFLDHKTIDNIILTITYMNVFMCESLDNKLILNGR